MDAPGSLVLIQGLNDRPDRLAGVITVEHIEVDEIGLLARQRIHQIGGNVIGRDALAILVVMGALAEHHHFVAQPAFIIPVAQGALAVAVAITVRRVKGGAAQGIDAVEQRHTLFELLHADHHRALYQARDGFINAGDLAVFHWLVPVLMV